MSYGRAGLLRFVTLGLFAARSKFICHRGTHRIGKTLQRGERSAYAVIGFAADPGIEQNLQTRCPGNFHNIHGRPLVKRRADCIPASLEPSRQAEAHNHDSQAGLRIGGGFANSHRTIVVEQNVSR